MVERAFTGFTALPPPASDAPPKRWWEVLEISEHATVLEINAAYRSKAAKAHPDQGGTHDAMADLNAARAAGLAARAMR